MILYYFDNWNLVPIFHQVQQYDNMATKLVIKNIPPNWTTWYAVISKKGFLNVIELDKFDDSTLEHVFTASELAFNGKYSIQLQAIDDEKRKHSTVNTFTAGQTLSGDEQWVEIPSAFTQAVTQATDAKNEALIAMQNAIEASGRYPYIDEETGNWFSWDVEHERFVDTGIHAQGPAGPAGATFIYSQQTASSEWHIEHNLSKFPSVTIADSADNIVVGDVTYVDLSTIDIHFEAPFSGYAYLN